INIKEFLKAECIAVLDKSAILRGDPAIISSQDNNDFGIRKALRKLLGFTFQPLIKLARHKILGRVGVGDNLPVTPIFVGGDIMHALKLGKHLVLQIGGGGPCQADVKKDFLRVFFVHRSSVLTTAS